MRNRFDELHKDLEWAEMTECYPKASAVYRMIERLEEIYKENIIRLLTTIIHHQRTRAVPVMDDIQEILI